MQAKKEERKSFLLRPLYPLAVAMLASFLTIDINCRGYEENNYKNRGAD
jgi:hypothetical protein